MGRSVSLTRVPSRRASRTRQRRASEIPSDFDPQEIAAQHGLVVTGSPSDAAVGHRAPPHPQDQRHPSSGEQRTSVDLNSGTFASPNQHVNSLAGHEEQPNCLQRMWRGVCDTIRNRGGAVQVGIGTGAAACTAYGLRRVSEQGDPCNPKRHLARLASDLIMDSAADCLWSAVNLPTSSEDREHRVIERQEAHGRQC